MTFGEGLSAQMAAFPSRPDYTKGYTAHTAASARKGRGHSSNLQECTSSDLFTDDVGPGLESAREKVRAFYTHASPLREVSSSLLFVFLRSLCLCCGTLMLMHLRNMYSDILPLGSAVTCFS
jgi:hypothetical protein